MNLFLNCPSYCVYQGWLSWEGICPILNLVILLSYFLITIITLKFIYMKLKDRFVKNTTEEMK